jgi:excinuclease ABC subunit C
MMIDGGKGQLSAAHKARDELGLNVPMVGLAKRLELLIVPTWTGESREGLVPDIPTKYRYDRRPLEGYSFQEVELPMNSPGLVLLRRLRDEAHRFALTYHRKLRDKSMSGSVLEEIPGIGPRRKRLLLRTFGSIEAIRRASLEELASVPTMTARMAQIVKGHLEGEL